MSCTASGTLDAEHTWDSKSLKYLPLFLLKIFAFKVYCLFGVQWLNYTFWGKFNVKQLPSVNTCSKPDIANSVISPANDTVDFGSSYTFICNNGYTASSTEAMNCTTSGTLDSEHTCDSKPLQYLPLFLLKILAFKVYRFLVFSD